MRTLRDLKPGTLGWWLSPWRLGYWWFKGVNLWEHDGEILVTKKRSLVGHRADSGFWPAGRLIRYRRTPDCQYLFRRMWCTSTSAASSTMCRA